MLRILRTRTRQGHRTSRLPDEAPALPERFRGRPQLDAARCPDGCRACIEACPTEALRDTQAGLALDLGRCLFCSDCVEACPEGAIAYTQDHRLAVRRRDDLLTHDGLIERAPARASARPAQLLDAALAIAETPGGPPN